MSLDSKAAGVQEAIPACVTNEPTRTMKAETHGDDRKETVIETSSGGAQTMLASDSA
jgi:hypothetical protein